jgi:ubiquinone/menaquinone biosynthesis C-methylase UbiE
MGGQVSAVKTNKVPDPQPIFDTATGFMRAKHLFVAAELGVFEALANGAKPLAEIARELKLPPRTTRIIVDAVTALGFLERDAGSYRNTDLTQVYLSGQGPQDMRPFMRFWNRLSYRRWLTLEDSVRLGRGASGEFNFPPDEQKIFSEGVEAFSAGQAVALSQKYDFSRHQRLLDLGGGTGSFLREIIQRYPHLEGTLLEFPAAASVAREKLRGTECSDRIKIFEGNFLTDSIPAGHDLFLVANVVHVLTAEQNLALFRRVREMAGPKARLLLVDLWTNTTHTEPLFAALMAGEFLVVGGNGDVYSVEEGREWLEQAGWHFVEHSPLAGPASMLVAEP